VLQQVTSDKHPDRENVIQHSNDKVFVS